MLKFCIGLGAAVVTFVHIREADKINRVENTLEDLLDHLYEQAQREYQQSIDQMFNYITEGLDDE